MKVEGIKEAEAWKGGGVLSAGYHTVRIEEAKEGESTNRHPQFELEFGNDEGSIRDWLVVVPSTMGKLKQLLDATGVEPDNEEVTPAQLEGKKLMIHVRMEPHQDPSKGDRARVNQYLPLKNSEGPNGAPADDSDLPF